MPHIQMTSRRSEEKYDNQNSCAHDNFVSKFGEHFIAAAIVVAVALSPPSTTGNDRLRGGEVNPVHALAEGLGAIRGCLATNLSKHDI